MAVTLWNAACTYKDRVGYCPANVVTDKGVDLYAPTTACKTMREC